MISVFSLTTNKRFISTEMDGSVHGCDSQNGHIFGGGAWSLLDFLGIRFPGSTCCGAHKGVWMLQSATKYHTGPSRHFDPWRFYIWKTLLKPEQGFKNMWCQQLLRSRLCCPFAFKGEQSFLRGQQCQHLGQRRQMVWKRSDESIYVKPDQTFLNRRSSLWQYLSPTYNAVFPSQDSLTNIHTWTYIALATQMKAGLTGVNYLPKNKHNTL